MMTSNETSASVFTGKPSQQLMDELSRKSLVGDFGTRKAEDGGIGLTFKVDGDNVISLWNGSKEFESYGGIVHGGILATILDDAMVHLLFAHGIITRTGQIELRYKNSVRSSEPVEIRASVKKGHRPLFFLEATIRQNGILCVAANAKLMEAGKGNKSEKNEKHS